MSKTPPNLKPHQIALFDRGYVDYKQYTKWASNKTYFVTRLKDNAVYEQLREIHIPNDIPDNYITDLKVQVKYKDAEGKEQLLVLRWVVY